MPDDEEIVITGISLFGVELYMWGNGRGRADVNEFLDSELELPSTLAIDLPPTARLIERS